MFSSPMIFYQNTVKLFSFIFEMIYFTPHNTIYLQQQLCNIYFFYLFTIFLNLSNNYNLRMVGIHYHTHYHKSRYKSIRQPQTVRFIIILCIPIN